MNLGKKVQSAVTGFWGYEDEMVPHPKGGLCFPDELDCEDLEGEPNPPWNAKGGIGNQH